MEIEHEEYQPPPPRIPRGHSRVEDDSDPSEPSGSRANKPKTERERVDRDLAELCEEQIPDIPITLSSPQLHREKNYIKRWPFNACVARPVGKKEFYATPAALQARDN